MTVGIQQVDCINDELFYVSLSEYHWNTEIYVDFALQQHKKHAFKRKTKTIMYASKDNNVQPWRNQDECLTNINRLDTAKLHSIMKAGW